MIKLISMLIITTMGIASLWLAQVQRIQVYDTLRAYENARTQYEGCSRSIRKNRRQYIALVRAVKKMNEGGRIFLNSFAQVDIMEK